MSYGAEYFSRVYWPVYVSSGKVQILTLKLGCLFFFLNKYVCRSYVFRTHTICMFSQFVLCLFLFEMVSCDGYAPILSACQLPALCSAVTAYWAPSEQRLVTCRSRRYAPTLSSRSFTPPVMVKLFMFKSVMCAESSL